MWLSRHMRRKRGCPSAHVCRKANPLGQQRLFCFPFTLHRHSRFSQPDSKNGALSVTWPLDNMAYAKSTTREHVIGEDYIASSLNYSVRIIIAGKPRLPSSRGDRAPMISECRGRQVYCFPLSPSPACHHRMPAPDVMCSQCGSYQVYSKLAFMLCSLLLCILGVQHL